MAGKPQKVSPKTIGRKAAAKKVAPPQRAKPASSGGSLGYAGYEYQVQVTVWVALVLMVAKSASDSIFLETKTDEDIEASIQEPDNASLGMSDAKTELILQVKSRSSAPWGAAGFATVLTGEVSFEEGSRQRKRPLDLLLEQPKRRYLFITNESLNAGLRSFQIDSLTETPQQGTLPATARRRLSASEQADVSRRIAIVSGMTEELLNSKLKRVLSTHCHVPASQQDSCIRDLADLVRLHMRGKLDGKFTKKVVLDVCARHGGSLLPTRLMDHYVRPKSFDSILHMLGQRHAVIIAGPSGNGKSLTADIVEHELRTSDPPYSVVYAELGPSSIRSELLRTDSVLFHLRDPWGSNRISSEAETWSSELPKLLSQANAGHKFLITSRSDVMSGAMRETAKRLASYVIPIELEDYGPKRLELIYDGISSDLAEYPSALARQFRSKALANLSRPYEIDRFLATLSQGDPDKPRNVADILNDSQIDAISSVVCEQVINLGDESVAAAAILWGVLKAREAVTRDVLLRLARKVRRSAPAVRSDMDGLIEFLVAGRNLRSDRETISFSHPRVEDGLRLAIHRMPLDTEEILSHLVDGLVAQDIPGNDWGVETALSVLRATNGEDAIEIAPSDEARAGIDKFLTHSFFNAKRTSDSARTLSELAEYGSPTHLFTKLAKLLNSVGKQSRGAMFGNSWKALPLSDKTLARLRQDSRTTEFLERFITDVLPFSRIRYDRRLGELFRSMATGLDVAYRKAVEIIAHPGGPNENMEAIIEGACSVESPDYDWLIEQFAVADAEASAWLETFQPEYRQAEEHEVDAAYADRLFDEPGDQFYNSQTGLKKIALLRSKRQGTQWLEAHPHRDLLVDSLANAIQDQTGPWPVEDLRKLAELAGVPGSSTVWKAIQKHWDSSFEDALLRALMYDAISSEHLRETLLTTFFEHTDEATAILRASLPGVSLQRRFELLVDVMTTSLPEDGRGVEGSAERLTRTHELLKGFEISEAAVANALVSGLSGATIRDAVASLSPKDKSLLETLLEKCQTSTTQYLAGLAVAAGIDASVPIARLLATGEAVEGENAVLALGLRATKSNRAQLHEALNHPRYLVRQEAMKRLLPAVAVQERSSMLFLSKDRSADVRLAWAEIMSELRWPEGVPSLIDLMSDTRNFNSDPGFANGPSWPMYSVGRAAASALCNYEELPTIAINALLALAEGENSDPFVICATLSALAVKDDSRIGPTLARSLEALGFEDSPNHRPVAQAAAWAIFDRARAQKGVHYDANVEKAILGRSPVIAGPVLMALALSAHAEIAAIEKKLKQNTLLFRMELLDVATAMFQGAAPANSAAPASDLAQLASGSTLSENQMQSLQEWSRSLEPKRDVQRFTAWLAEKGCKLPTKEDIGDPRDYDLPERIGFMSMRSLTPFREVNDRTVDRGH